MKRSKKFPMFLYIATSVSFILPALLLIVWMISGKSDRIGMDSPSDAGFLLMQCLLGLVTINLPSILERRMHFELPVALYGCYMVFLYCAISLGEIRSFYYRFPHWDMILHLFSSVMTGLFGMMVITILNRNERVSMRLSPIFMAVFAFTFSVTIGALWEIFEYAADGLIGANMQKYITAQGTVLAGHDALTDTMKDLCVDAVGAVLASAFGYFSVRLNFKWYIPVLTDEK